ncbi:MAG TPA: FHA domain-containing protein [Gemmatimonadales bacterium]|nr:FHA domain-containing protein [Gemmatimonadales bacterium]
MPYIRLVESNRPGQPATEARESPLRIGREPGSTILFGGDAAKVVSTRHAEIRFEGGGWVLADLSSRNGTYLNGRRVGPAPTPALKVGDTIRLGESGPELRIAAVAEVAEETLAEHPALDAKPAEVRAYGVTLLAAATGKRYEARGTRIRLGRGSECEVQPVEAGGETIVSRVHAELTVGPSGALVLRDAESKNGTYLNGERITRSTPVRLGDKIMLGQGGPVLLVEGMGTAPVKAVPRPQAGAGLGQQTVIGLIGQALARARDEKKKGGRGTTAFMKAVAEEVGKDSRRKIRWLTSLVILLILLLGGGVYGVYWLLSQQEEHTEQALRTAGDSARAETERLRRELGEARAAAAPAEQVELLRGQLEAAQERTNQLQAALDRAQHALGDQLAAGETRRVEAQRDLQRMREQLADAERRAPSQGLIDSLRRAVSTAETQTATLDAKLRAIRATDFAGLAQQNQGAVGLITVALGGSYYDGTGFIISPDGYMLTNWHVVADSTHAQPDTIWVTMADQSLARLADVVATSRERDVSIIKIRNYQGPSLSAIDWQGTKARQGEPAALIGYPAGSGFARDRASVVRTSMTAGILSRVTSDLIQFDGMTTGGSSGSPVFNADGEVISVHRAGLRQGPGFALSVPVKYAIPLMPPGLRQRLGL